MRDRSQTSSHAGSNSVEGNSSSVEKKKNAAYNFYFSRITIMRFSGDPVYDFWVTVAIVLIVICGLAEISGSTPYGRFGGSTSFGLDPRIGWWLMELPCTVSFCYFFFVKSGPQANNIVPRLLAALFLMHYSYRGWIFPTLIRVHGNSKNFDLTIALGGWIVTILHGYLNGQWYARFGRHLNSTWLQTYRFRCGVSLYLVGFFLIIWHDSILRSLRDSTDGPRYRIPVGGLFDYATCAQYFAELVAWLGFAIMSWGPNGAFIFIVSLVNLVPRSVRSHHWYIAKFGEQYPAERAYLIPFIW